MIYTKTLQNVVDVPPLTYCHAAIVIVHKLDAQHNCALASAGHLEAFFQVGLRTRCKPRQTPSN